MVRSLLHCHSGAPVLRRLLYILAAFFAMLLLSDLGWQKRHIWDQNTCVCHATVG